MHSEFEMSMMGELNFFLGLQIKQLKEGTFINQAKYIRDLLKRFNMEEAKTMKTPMTSSIKLDMDEKGKPVNSTMYRGMIDADFAGCKVERKSTSGTCHFLGHSLASWHSKKQNSVALSTAEAKYIAAGGRPVEEPVDRFVGAENLKRPPRASFLPFSLLELAAPSHPCFQRRFWVECLLSAPRVSRLLSSTSGRLGFRVGGCFFLFAFLLSLDFVFSFSFHWMAPQRETGTSRAQGKSPAEPSPPEQIEAL
ncbi:hypothetical protein CK203_092516 [Vitis vinifera]|uniref:Reverse transcriptase Ty1/copia-type domain-containing protein n=1 Tax=Vitis vinifera TaxID=29760 RepID=A0A438DHP0_VITVI|nr:hypothetical protein CK203_092516 [Vitis vinifera]